MINGWTEQETSTHQDHVIAHVVGATALGYFIFDESAYLLLDIGFVWRIYLDGEMGLLPSSVAVRELEGDAELQQQLLADVDLLAAQGRAALGLQRITATPVDCLIKGVSLFANDNRRRLIITGEPANVVIEMSLETGNIDLIAGA